MTEPPIQPRRRRSTQLLAWAACGIVLAFVVAALVRQFGQIEWGQVHFQILPMVLATLCLVGVAGVQLLARWALLEAYGQHLSWRQVLAVSWVPAIGKYVISGIASVGGAVALLCSWGVPGAVAFSVTILLDALAVLAGFIVSTPLLLSEPVRQKMPLAWLGGVLISIVGIVMLHPRIFVGMLNLVLKRFGKQPIDRVPPLSRYLWPALASFAQWLFAGLSLWLMTRALMNVSIGLIPLFIASAALATVIGYLTPFAPGGIGVREGLYLLTIGPVIGPNVAIVAVAMRVIQTLLELLLAAIGLMLMRGVSVPQRQTDTA